MLTINQISDKRRSRRGVKRKGSRSKAFYGAPIKRGTCTRVTTMKPKKPNSAQRKIAKVKLNCGWGKQRYIICYIPGQGHSLREFSDVLIRGGRVPDLPGVQYHLIRGVLDFDWKENVFRRQGRSKYGIKLEDSLSYFGKAKKLKKSR